MTGLSRLYTYYKEIDVLVVTFLKTILSKTAILQRFENDKYPFSNEFKKIILNKKALFVHIMTTNDYLIM